MDFKKYQHICKLGTSEVEGILNGTCYLTYKIDGTNACIFLKDIETGELGFGSRNRELTETEDNAGFVKHFKKTSSLVGAGEEQEVTTYTEEYIQIRNYLLAHPTHIIYGEWLIPVTLKSYSLEARKQFYVFDVYDAEKDLYIEYDIWTKEFKEVCPVVNIIPLLAKLENPTTEDIEGQLSNTGKFLVTQGLGEGIVIKNYSFVNSYGRTTWAKLLTEDFKKTKNKTRKDNSQEKQENTMEYSFIKLMTPEHIIKEYNKFIERKGEWKQAYIAELLTSVFNEFLTDNIEIALKKLSYPIINFRVLKKLADNKIKEILSL